MMYLKPIITRQTLHYGAVGLTLAALIYCTASAPWVAMNGGHSAVTINGFTLEWEWMDVGQSILFLEGNQQYRARLSWPDMTLGLSDQNAARMTPAVIIAVLGGWTPTIWHASIIATWLVWFITYLAMYRLLVLVCKRTTNETAPSRTSIIFLAFLVCTSPGFLAFSGSIDVHPFGYAGAALGVLFYTWSLTEGYERTARNNTAHLRHVLALSTSLFLLDGTIQLGAPFSMFLLAVSCFLFLNNKKILLFSIIIIASFFFLRFLWQLLAFIGSHDIFVAHNDAISRLSLLFFAPQDFIHYLTEVQTALLETYVDTYGYVLLLVFFLGWLRLSRFDQYSTTVWIILITLITVLLRPLPRTLYLTFPVIYTTASNLWTFKFSPRSVPVMNRVMSSLGYIVMVAMATQRLGFLWGNLQTPAIWWPPN